MVNDTIQSTNKFRTLRSFSCFIQYLIHSYKRKGRAFIGIPI